MPWNPPALSLLAFAAAVIIVAVVGVGWHRRRDGIESFAALMLVIAFWTAIYGVQLGFTTKPEQISWQRLALATSGGVPPLFLFFAYQYAGKQELLTRRVKALLVGEWAAFTCLALTNPIHHLVWTRATLYPRTVSPALDLEFATGYFVHIAFAYAVVALGLWTILSVYFKSSQIYRRQSALLLIGAVPAFVSHNLFTLKSSPVPGLDFTPFVFTFTGVTYGLALFHFDLLERTPVAHQRAIELTGDGLLVVDGDGRIVDSNHVARQIYDIDRAGETPVSSVLGTTDLQNLHGTTTSIIDGTRRVYELYVSELSFESGLHAGSAIVLRDVTDREAYEQRLEVANRVLRHNLRNDMNVVSGYADLLRERASTDEQQELAEVIRRKSDGLVAVSEKAHQMVDIEQTAQGDGEAVDVCATLASLASEFREEYPEVPVAVDCPDDVTVTAVSKQALTIALRNLLENAFEHNDTADLSVEVTVTTEERQTQIRVSDDGAGLPEMEQDVLKSRTETPLQHSSGLGLWLTYWTVSTTGGEISVTASESEGTTITLLFPTQGSAAGTTAMRPAGRNTL
ncbi:histidine kinase N-terminal 7TM domain-containing protein [Halorussus halophilus]|uniref:histidine kinase N-terminal 7TM domain-containing protein n=1 Tax=Halorussus halophilus TaxID=2650975 RepID=UPI00130192F4|nr:histidine kinase N-terminal 7TM domain-containing protein [Halorussus halophilus]